MFSSLIFIIYCFFTLYKKTLSTSFPFIYFSRTFCNYPSYGNSILFDEVANLQEIKRLRIKGCTLIYNDRTLQEKELMDKIEKSKHFASAEIIERLKPNDLNLTGFDMYLTLKTPIKK